MRNPTTAGEPSESQQRNMEQAEVAALAAKVVKLPHDGNLRGKREPLFRSPPKAAKRRSPPHGWLWWACFLTAWTATLALMAVAALRIFYHDGTYLLIWLNAFTRYVYLPAYASVLWALWQRRWILAAAGSFVVVCHLVWMAPDFLPDRRYALPAGADASVESPSVRVFFANVLRTNREHEAMLQEIAAANPDVVVVSEWGWRWHKAFKQSSLPSVYIHGTSVRQPQLGGGVNIFSKLPLENEMENWITGRLVRTADVQVGSESLRILAVHAPRPEQLTAYDYHGFYSKVIPLIATERGPLLVIGDFNATEHSLVYQRIEATGLRSAHEDRGRGYATTWPNAHYWLPPIRIDQAFLSPEVECERIVEGRGRGSDHKPLIVDIRIRESVHLPPPASADKP